MKSKHAILLILANRSSYEVTKIQQEFDTLELAEQALKLLEASFNEAGNEPFRRKVYIVSALIFRLG